MSNRELIDVAFLAAVLVILVGSFIYVNAFYQEPPEEEEEEADGGEDGDKDGADEKTTGSAFDAYVVAEYIGAESPAPLCL